MTPTGAELYAALSFFAALRQELGPIQGTRSVNINEVTAMALLFRACQDEEIQRRALTLVPGLKDLIVVTDVPVANENSAKAASARERALRVMDYCATHPTAEWSPKRITELIGD